LRGSAAIDITPSRRGSRLLAYMRRPRCSAVASRSRASRAAAQVDHLALLDAPRSDGQRTLVEVRRDVAGAVLSEYMSDPAARHTVRPLRLEHGAPSAVSPTAVSGCYLHGLFAGIPTARFLAAEARCGRIV
jgi:hypothetical protein